ncbi:hypothetical protein [Alkalihalobacillus sp. BA299]|uniref:hypothetical protein n=1 Tax=Alkalihalobacillus sp. BA299 TaxID=2815938 RepID=UPI001AD97CE9|nr:hypothetical protein [Alkalihalobacillus sp. BA299]
METKSSRSGFTKLGFSKAGFSACSHWASCSMGKLECHYAAIDPEVKNYCGCYQRHHSIPKEKTYIIKSVETSKTPIETKNNFYKFENLEGRLLGKSLVDSLNTKVGEQFILRPTNQNIGTHFFVNRSSDNEWLGCYEVKDFEILKEFANEKELLDYLSIGTEKELKVEKSFENMEQLSLF